MRNVLKAETLERRFPLLSVENGCIVSKDADLTVAFEVELPELYTVTADEYEAMHSSWIKAVKVLPEHSVVCKQDWFVKETYRPKTDDGEQSFLTRSYELHFNERPYLNHKCYLFLTKTTRERSRRKSDFNTLCRGFLLPKEITDKDAAARFLEAVEQFERIMNDSGHIRLRRLETDEITGTKERPGLVEKYFSLSLEDETAVLQDICLKPGRMRIGDKRLCLHTLSDTEDLPGRLSTDMRYERMSTDRSDCRLSFAAPVGLLLSCNHIYSQYVFIDDAQEILQMMEKNSRNMLSLSKYSRSNAINQEWTEMYLDEAHTKGVLPVRCHCNVIAWAEDAEEFRRIRNDTGSQLAMMECTPRYNTIDTPVIYWAGIPGNAGDFPSEESFYTFLEQAVCLFAGETNYKSSPSPFGIRLADRQNGIPVHVDISDLPMKRGIITNRNKFILGPSGSGKSFFTNHLVRQYYEQGAHILLVDTGNSYQGLCRMIHDRTNGKDGIYITYEEDNPISFNPFYTESGKFDVEKRDSINTLILTLWKREDESPKRSEEVALSGAVNAYIRKISENRNIRPDFNGFYEFVADDYRRMIEEKKVREKDFDIDGFLNVLEPFYRGGDYDFLLNSDKELDLTGKRFIVFELDNISSNKVLLPVVTLIIMETFIAKMRRLKGIRKMILIEECWKALMSANMSEYIKYLFKTVRKYFGEAVVVTQEVDDIISSPIVKEAIINNSDCKILLDQRKYINKFEHIQRLLGLTEKEKGQILSINQANHPGRFYREVWIGLGGTCSAVYATEVSEEEYFTFTTEESEKLEVQRIAGGPEGSLEGAIRRLAEKKREEQKQVSNPK
ncbi:TraG family conjugative transposon ATPase [Phocaeicola vulgatus]|jgi:conjugation system TraG family ATPase|uniref:TraG family conjugative transposon ATPase n=1 Tax=Bacteroides uniformis TaxID=820 RepID=A0A3E5ERB3_BACUN|nr:MULTISPECIES: TraG family conjugative transposon ATPase [Bacteroidales]MBU9061821.1 TraG family conjugative transposon ATPase [Parabacteroides merdae]MBV4210098.1 TraG family conjugative transposon ATPase [Phocaeicola vulgatus]MBV4214499.1 TraG family conjugative transposon ATPase [Phocaeicola vulgatus]MBX9054611.1 TraG family conjugative transposon ATPase [Parabacteroides merdae]MBX9059871.1 TraG family conjugative transposon ATPase [Parabacteroides distasonis]